MGGDLNMKKFFHPLTMDNLERVWKAEERKRQEEAKVEQLQQELADERRREELQRLAVETGLKKKTSDKLDWMYNFQSANREDYLLGKKIDQNVECMKEEPQSLSAGTSSATTSAPVLKAKEVLAKIKEDPLFLIKKKEEENRKDLMHNPIKMRKLKELLQTNADAHKKKITQEKEGKDRRTSKQPSSSEEEDARGKATRGGNHYSKIHAPDRGAYEREKYASSKDSWIDTESHREHEQGRKPSRSYGEIKYQSRHKLRRRRGSASSSDSEPSTSGRRDPEYGLLRKSRKEKSPESKRQRRASDEVSGADQRHAYGKRYVGDNAVSRKGFLKSEDSSGDEGSSNKSRERHQKSANHTLTRPFKNDRATKSMDDDEMEKRRQEMLGNAKWRDEQRGANVKKYTDMERKEEASVKSMLDSSDEHAKVGFIKKMQVDSYSSKHTSSVEDRIRRNIHSKQRTTAALEHKFTSR